ncbi:MAG: hypothetical protein WAK40_00485 [Thermoplasmata archaeon]
MADPAPRRVRVARPPPSASVAESSPPVLVGEAVERSPPELRRIANRGATRRVRRLALLYVVVLAALYFAISLLARSSAQGTSTGSGQDVELFGLIALAFALVGVTVTLLSAPASVELTATSTVIVSPFGTRRTYPPVSGLTVRIARRYSPGWLTPEPVDSVEIGGRGGRQTFLIDTGVFSDTDRRSG